MPWLDNPCPPIPSVNDRLDEIEQAATSANEMQVVAAVIQVRGIAAPGTSNPEAHVAAAWAASIATPPNWGVAEAELLGIT